MLQHTELAVKHGDATDKLNFQFSFILTDLNINLKLAVADGQGNCRQQGGEAKTRLQPNSLAFLAQL